MMEYRGPASIGGVSFPAVSLQEHHDGNLRSWTGSATFPAAAQPAGFTADFLNSPSATVVLPDGREGTAYVATSFDGSRWTLDLTGTGPAPWASE